MAPAFSPRHLPALLAGGLNIAGGVVTLVNPQRAVVGYGLPVRVAGAPGAGALMAIFGARAAVLGVLLLLFYARGQLAAVDDVLAVLGLWAGLVDAWVLRREGCPDKGLLRLVASWAVAACGLVGLTQGGGS